MFMNTGMPEMQKMLDVLAQRHRVIANNVANAQTPGYKTQELDFQQVLEEIQRIKQESVDPEQAQAAIAEIGAAARTVAAGIDAEDASNDVEIEEEMVKMTANALLFKTYARVLSLQLSQVRMAINEKV